jgi:hypothetical protein
MMIFPFFVFILTAVPKNITFKYLVPLSYKLQAFALQAVFERLSMFNRELEGNIKRPVVRK